MSRMPCLDKFYNLLDDLEKKIGGRRRLGDCDGRMAWPTRGVYFFFEPGEMRTVKPSASRVVRVGANAVGKTETASPLWERIKKHRGVKTRRGGDHRSSVFRCLVGEAIGRHTKTLPESWGEKLPIPQEMWELEYPHEIRVSEYLADMTLLFVCVPGPSGPNNIRKIIESNAIALLSGYRKPSPDKPSSGWLGRHSRREEVKHSGLWNNEHVNKKYNPAFLEDLEKFIKAM